MVHGLEEPLVEILDIIRIQCVSVVKSNLQTAFSSTENHCSRRRVVSRRTDNVNDTWAELLEEFRSYHIPIYIVPQILAEHGKRYALLIGARHEVVVHVGTDILHLVEITQVVWLEEINLHERVEWEGVFRTIERIVGCVEDGLGEIIVAT